MKKLLGVSIAAMLAVTPMLASADPATNAQLNNEATAPVASAAAPYKPVTVDSTAKIATTSYVQGAYNDAIAAVNKVNADKQANLMNGTGQGAQQVSSTVKTTVGDAESATDTALVTEKAVRTAIAGAITAAGGQTETQVKALIGAAAAGATDGLTGNAEAGTLAINYDNSTIDLVASGDNAGKLEVKAGGITSTQLATDSVTGAKIADGAVSFSKMASGAVVTSNDTLGTAGAEGTASDQKLITEKTFVEALNATGGMVTATGTQTLTNKTIDADDNTISDLETDNFKSGVVQTSVRNASNASDTALASEKAVRTEVDNLQTGIRATISYSTVPVYTTWGADTNTTVYVDPAATYQTTVRQ